MKNTGSEPKPAFRDEPAPPSPQTLGEALGANYALYEKLMQALAGPEMGMTAEWRYYNDGKSWLCKVAHGGKTILWLSVWDDRTVRISFYFAQSNTEGVMGLEIGEQIKTAMRNAVPIGRLVPLIVELSEGNTGDILTIADYKKRLK